MPRSTMNAVMPLWLLARSTAGEDEEMVGDVGQGDPDLGAVEDVVVAVAAGSGLEIGRVGADARLGQAEVASFSPAPAAPERCF